MIIYPSALANIPVSDVVAGWNRSPSPGDDGHVADHERLAKLLFEVPNTEGNPLGMVEFTDGEWSLTVPPADPRAATFAEVREFVESPGSVAIDFADSTVADGETDHTSDAEFGDLSLMVFPAGLLGMANAVSGLASQINSHAEDLYDLNQRLSALEQG